MPRTTPVLRAIKLLSLIERNAQGLGARDMAEQLRATPRAIYRDLQILEELRVTLYTDKNGRESFWKIDLDYRNPLSISFNLQNFFLFILHKTQFSRCEGPFSTILWSLCLRKCGRPYQNRSSGRCLTCAAAFSQGFLPKKTMASIGSSSR